MIIIGIIRKDQKNNGKFKSVNERNYNLVVGLYCIVRLMVFGGYMLWSFGIKGNFVMGKIVRDNFGDILCIVN